MQQLLPDHSLKSLAELVGTLPAGDVPTAWYLSTHPEVLDAYQKFQVDHKAWRDRFAELCECAGLTAGKVKMSTYGGESLRGLYDKPTKDLRWWRLTKDGIWTPRKRTKAEKNSVIAQRFRAAAVIPCAVSYLPGMPHSLWLPGPEMATTVYPVHVRKSGEAVVVFLGAEPEDATEFPFEVGPQWSRMKLSTYHALKERQEAEGGH